jgi:hypothetical protein
VWTRLAVVALSFVAAALGQNNPPQTLPSVTSGQFPSYPILARAARIQGDVRLRVTTDGETVASVAVEGGPPLLSKAAEETVKTWKFKAHAATVFSIIFSYQLETEIVSGSCDPAKPDNGTVTLRLPSEVVIRSHVQIPDCPVPVDPARVFLSDCSIDASAVPCERLTIILRSGDRRILPSRFKESDHRQGFMVPEDFRTLKDFEVIVESGNGAFTIPKLDIGFLKGEWHVGIDHAPFKEDTPVSYDAQKVPPDTQCLGYVVFEGEPGVVSWTKCN